MGGRAGVWREEALLVSEFFYLETYCGLRRQNGLGCNIEHGCSTSTPKSSLEHTAKSLPSPLRGKAYLVVEPNCIDNSPEGMCPHNLYL